MEKVLVELLEKLISKKILGHRQLKNIKRQGWSYVVTLDHDNSRPKDRKKLSPVIAGIVGELKIDTLDINFHIYQESLVFWINA